VLLLAAEGGPPLEAWSLVVDRLSAFGFWLLLNSPFFLLLAKPETTGRQKKKATGKWRCFGSMFLKHLPTYLISFIIFIGFLGVSSPGEFRIQKRHNKRLETSSCRKPFYKKIRKQSPFYNKNNDVFFFFKILSIAFLEISLHGDMSENFFPSIKKKTHKSQ
jgi:hypothetical protein